MKIGLFSGAFLLSFCLTVVIRFSVGFSAAESTVIPVSLPVDDEVSADKRQPLDIELQWGGFYTCEGPRGYWVFRLLDINARYYHFVSYRRLFPNKPEISDVTYLVPISGHNVKRSSEILDIRPEFIGTIPLERDDLADYEEYLGEKGLEGGRITAELNRIIGFSQDDPLLTRLSLQNGELGFESVVH